MCTWLWQSFAVEFCEAFYCADGCAGATTRPQCCSMCGEADGCEDCFDEHLFKCDNCGEMLCGDCKDVCKKSTFWNGCLDVMYP